MLEKQLTEKQIQSYNSRRLYTVNDNYFSTESHNMAYILGILASDGNIAKDENKITIELSIIDKELLERIAQELNLTKELSEYITAKGSHLVKLSFNSIQIKKDLATYNIVPSKTFILKPPSLQAEFVPDFIRGYFDGDGMVSSKARERIFVEIGGASKELIEFIKLSLESYGIQCPPMAIRRMSSGNKFYLLHYSVKSSEKIYHLFYDNESLYLKRKKDKFTSLMK